MLRSSWVSRKSGAWLWDTVRKRDVFILFYIVLRSFQLLWTTGLIQVGFSTKCTSPNEDFNQNRKRKCHIINWFPKITPQFCPVKLPVSQSYKHLKWKSIVKLQNISTLKCKSVQQVIILSCEARCCIAYVFVIRIFPVIKLFSPI